MAWVFSLSAECGPSKEDAEAFARHFVGPLGTPSVYGTREDYDPILPDWEFALSNGATLSLHITVWRDREHNWWCSVWPQLGEEHFEWGHELHERHGTEAGHALYQRLRSAPTFRYAMAGVEVDGVRQYSKWDERDMASSHFHGLVLCRGLWERLGRPANFEPFVPGYSWIPYRGEE
jgi:hypothetical protein